MQVIKIVSHEYLWEHEKSEKYWRKIKGVYLQNNLYLSC